MKSHCTSNGAVTFCFGYNMLFIDSLIKDLIRIQEEFIIGKMVTYQTISQYKGERINDYWRN